MGRNFARDQFMDLHKLISTGKDLDDAVSTLLVEEKIKPQSLDESLRDMLALIDEHGDRTLIKAHATRIASARISLAMNNLSLRAVLEDFVNNGVRHDCNPTLCLDGDQNKLIAFFYDYIRSIDTYVRTTAKSALDNSVKEIHEYDGSDINEDLE
jgi:hypothetical protein